MALLGYTNAEKVALALGRDLEPDETARYAFVAEAAEQYINATTGRGWLGGPVTAERHTIQSGRVWLYQRPITAVTAVRIGGRFESPALLTATTDYVLDAARGLIVFRGYSSSEVEVDYTVPATVPATVAQAVTELTKAWLLGATANSMFKRWSMDGQSFEYRDPAELGAVPSVVEQLLAQWRRPVLA